MDRTVHTEVVAAAGDGRRDGRARGGRSRRGRQPYAWLGVGSVGLGLGVGVVLSAGVAHADGGRGDSSASGSGSSAMAGQGGFVNPLRLCRILDAVLPSRTIIVADGGDFVATASYTVKPRQPLSWLDPGVYGTLGVGAGFALAAKLASPQDTVVILYGDGASGYGLIEVRPGVGKRGARVQGCACF